ncbi:Fic family protein [Sphaerotilus mobilis]|uniref:Fic/DOC family protein n=1 Tax=Sphaerotilus mobilis TaxID=47994 RepID=A0A4Q7LST6_9BURK|nr:Fic family protein [Sphaerotilus mobilis]RZS57945.1 Fic/DOC family protein [Sphaerotilus mobilis]
MIGYEFLSTRIPLRLPPVARPAQVRPVTRIERLADLLAVPRHVAPGADATILEHVLFALKHEDMQMALLLEALRLVSAEELTAALSAQRTGSYLRKAAFLWEKAHGRELPMPWDSTGGNYVDLFDATDHYVGPVWERSQRLRVNFNGIGPFDFCPVVRRDDALAQRGQQVLDRLQAWASDPGHQGTLERVLSWAYLSETRDSFAIEQETPSPDKERAFLQALAHLRDRRPLSEDYLVELQNTVISSPLRVEAQFRIEQNWLQRGGHGALAVRYVPPPPDRLPALMDGWMRMANSQGGDVPPFVRAALVSFGFVYLHPFMDGNGRLSRLLAHHSLNLQQVLPVIGEQPTLLPLSVAMKRHEALYLATLESFSRPARGLWDVTYLADNVFAFEFMSTPQIYAHWDGDSAARFVTACAEQALTQSLIDETLFIQSHDRAFERIDREFDLPNRTINLLIQWIQQNGGRMPARRRQASELALMKAEQIDRIEAIVATSFQLTSLAPPTSPQQANEA